MSDQQRHRILLVDNEPMLRETWTMVLGELGYEVATATDAFDALAQLRRTVPDLIISDLNMPRMSGFEFLKIMCVRFPKIPLIGLSGVYDSNDHFPNRLMVDAVYPKGRCQPEELAQIVADLQFEMLGRPDPKVAAGTLWLTGFERSNLGPELAKQGAALVADPHPEQRFFQRSDNFPLALRGVIAHTVSSFGLHTDYHRASDDVSKIDFPFMTRSINSLVRPIHWLANSDFRPEWLPGQTPSR